MPDRTPGSAGRIEGAVIRRGDREYESARDDAVWNGVTPERFPEVIVRAAAASDVGEALARARAEGLRVSTRSGGHNWSGSALRDGGMLIDLSRLQRCSIDPGSATAAVGPGVTGRALAAALHPYGLAFPVGHCPTVAMGGYLLSGGLGWNSRAWGPACAEVQEIEAVTADGRTVRCSETENPGLFWAARGAGTGFFAVVTRFHLRLHPHPESIMSTGLTFPLAEVDRVTGWAVRTARELPPDVETSLVLAAHGPATDTAPAGPRLTIGATAFAASQEEALDALSAVDACPFAGRALSWQPSEPTSFAALHEGAGAVWPEGLRFSVDTLWSAETYETQLSRIADAVAHAPSGKSMVIAPVEPASQDPAVLRNMAFSPLGTFYAAGFAIWDDPSADETNKRWLREVMGAMDPRGSGSHYIAEADLEADASRSRRSYAPADWDRLTRLKAECDPANLFHSYLTP